MFSPFKIERERKKMEKKKNPKRVSEGEREREGAFGLLSL